MIGVNNCYVHDVYKEIVMCVCGGGGGGCGCVCVGGGVCVVKNIISTLWLIK